MLADFNETLEEVEEEEGEGGGACGGVGGRSRHRVGAELSSQGKWKSEVVL